MIDFPRAVTTAEHARAALAAAAHLLKQDDLPFAAGVAQFALQSTDLDELERTATSLYQIGLEHTHPFLPDLADSVLQWIESERARKGSSPPGTDTTTRT